MITFFTSISWLDRFVILSIEATGVFIVSSTRRSGVCEQPIIGKQIIAPKILTAPIACPDLRQAPTIIPIIFVSMLVASSLHLILTNFFCAWLSLSMYLLVVVSEACPAIAWTSRNDPPTNDAFLAQFVIAVLRPECELQPTNPNFRYHFWNILTIACADVPSPRCVWTTNFFASWIVMLLLSLTFINCFRTSLFIAINRPLFPLLASLLNAIWPLIFPSAFITIDHRKDAISFARNPALNDNSTINRFLSAFRRVRSTPTVSRVDDWWGFLPVCRCP